MTKLSERLAATADKAGFAPPVGSIIPYFPGYYGAAANGGGFTHIGPGTNDVAGVNSFTSEHWAVCDGTAPNDAESPIFNAAGRFLPELTDSRFHRGAASAGAAGGAVSNQIQLSIPQLPPHGHSVSATANTVNAPHDHPHRHSQSITVPSPGGSTTGIKETSVTNPGPDYDNGIFQQGLALSPILSITDNAPHGHPVTVNESNVGNADSINIEPQYVSLFYIMRIK